MKTKIDEVTLSQARIIANLLVFDGGRGVSISKLKKTLEEDFDNTLKECKKLFSVLGIELKNSEDKLFLQPSRQTYRNLVELDLASNLPRLSRKRRMILLRFLTLYYSQLEPNPISKHKLKFELNENFDINVTERDLKHLNRLGYINLIRNQFIDIGWKLIDSHILENFRQNLQSIFIEVFDLEQKLTKNTKETNGSEFIEKNFEKGSS